MFALLALLLGFGAANGSPVPKAKPAAGFAPFDLTYLPRASNSVLAVRPGALVKHFGEQDKMVSDTVRRTLAAGFAYIDGDLKAAPPPALTDIEQLVVSAKFNLNIESEKDGRSNFNIVGLSSGVVRTAQPFGWAKALTMWFPKAETVKHAGREYVRVPITVGKDTSHLAFFVADARTLAFDTDEDVVKGLLTRLDKKETAAVPPGWNEVCRELVAVCHDNTGEGWLTAPDAPKRDTDRALVTVGRKATSLAIGFSAGASTSLKVVATARDECDALDVRSALKAVVTSLSDEEETGAAIAKLFTRTEVNRTGKVVRARGEVKGNLLRHLLDPEGER